jgi:hypothetical protein
MRQGMLEGATLTWIHESVGSRGHRAIPIKRRPNVLKKTCVAGGMLIATTAGAIITSLPAFAGVPTWGGGGCCSSSHSRFFHNARNRNWNGNESENLNHIRLHLRNRNNNIAVARTEEERERERERRPFLLGTGGGTIGAPA